MAFRRRPPRAPDDESPEDDGHRRRTPQRSAHDKVMDLLARRGYSEFELRQKLACDYTAEQITEAIEFARENGWMVDPAELSERVRGELNRKRKSHRYIQQFLQAKGLPKAAREPDDEVQKARALIESKLDKQAPFDYEDQKKIYRWLANRGFDDETIRKVMYEKP
jgi:SOS response regulatory protein OraA/RecX